MKPLNQDDTFHFEALQVLGSARYYGADIGEVLNTLDKMAPGTSKAGVPTSPLAHTVCARRCTQERDFSQHRNVTLCSTSPAISGLRVFYARQQRRSPHQ